MSKDLRDQNDVKRFSLSLSAATSFDLANLSYPYGLHSNLCSASKLKYSSYTLKRHVAIVCPSHVHYNESVHYRNSTSHEPQSACMSPIESQSQHTRFADAGEQ